MGGATSQADVVDQAAIAARRQTRSHGITSMVGFVIDGHAGGIASFRFGPVH